jgi:putative addiction module component (TIGR02574 family)
MNSNLNEILKLSIPERILAVEAIWDSIVAKNKDYKISDGELKVLEDRYSEYKSNPNNVLSWEEVKTSILLK